MPRVVKGIFSKYSFLFVLRFAIPTKQFGVWIASKQKKLTKCDFRRCFGHLTVFPTSLLALIPTLKKAIHLRRQEIF